MHPIQQHIAPSDAVHLAALLTWRRFVPYGTPRPTADNTASPAAVVNCLPFLGYEKWEALLWLETLCTTSV